MLKARKLIADSENLTKNDLKELLPSGRQTKFVNRISWAVFHMSKAGLIERVSKGNYRLTDQGQKLLSRNPSRIDMNLLEQYPEYIQWRSKSETDPSGEEPKETPEEALGIAFRKLNASLETQLLDRVLNAKPAFLERVIVDLLISMGYGGGNPERGQVTGGSGDGGIDGKISEDTLGLDEIYVQAKKWSDTNPVSERELRNFVGAIDTAGTTKGVFVTTASFTRAAREFVERSSKRIVLIDGAYLAQLMVQYGIGVREQDQYIVKGLDEDYFDSWST